MRFAFHSAQEQPWRLAQDQRWRERPANRALALLLSTPQGSTVCHELAARVLGAIPGCQGASWSLPNAEPCAVIGHAEAITLVTRALIARGDWQQQVADPTLYGGAFCGTGHEGDLTTYRYYAGEVPDYPEGNGFPRDGAVSRAWFARLLWQACRDLR